MVAAGAVEVIAGTLTVAAVALLLVGAAVMWSMVRVARRWYRRRWMVVARAARAGKASGAAAAVASMPVADVSWWLVQRDRHRMWRAVNGADRAVAAAVAAEAPIGDLPALTRRMLETAESLDAALRVSLHSPAGSSRVRRQVAELRATAGHLQGAAVEALTAAAQPATAGLTDAVLVEVAALRHGLATLSTDLRR